MADPSTCPPLTRASVFQARELIRPHVHLTPVVTSATLTRLASTWRKEGDQDQDQDQDQDHDQDGTSGSGSGEREGPAIRLWFKCENLQRVGAFKVRGAFHAVERLKGDRAWVEGGGLERGVATHSSGNHAQALALAARESGIPAHIVMPSISAAPKVAATRGYGARVVFSGSTSTEREAAAARVVAETGATLVPPYDHPDIILGQGTLGLEFQEQVEAMMTGEEEKEGKGEDKGEGEGEGEGEGDSKKMEEKKKKKKRKAKRGLDAIVAPCGGGGMLSGVALSCEGTGIAVFGAEPSFEGADDCRRGLEAGRRVESVSTLTVADGLRTPVGRVPWGVIHGRGLVRRVFSVSEDEIKAALRLVLERMKLVIEPSAAVPLAVVLFNEEFRSMVEREAGEDGWDVGVVFSGGNVALENLAKLFAA